MRDEEKNDAGQEEDATNEPRDEAQDQEKSKSQSRRDMLKSAAGLAAAALGGAALASGGEAEAQLQRPQQRQFDPEQLRVIQPRASALAQDLNVQQIPLRNLGRAVPDLNQEGLMALQTDLAEYLQPLLDRNRGQLSDTTVTAVTDNVNVSS